jgi:hypothetical protein
MSELAIFDQITRLWLPVQIRFSSKADLKPEDDKHFEVHRVGGEWARD